MVDTSYNQTYAPFSNWSVRQASVPQTAHNVPSTINGGGLVQSSLIVTEGFSLISAGVTASQPGVMSIQRYLDAGGTVAQGVAQQVSLVANVAANLDILDGKPFASFVLTITNSSGATSNLTNFALLLQASTASASSGGVAQAVSWSGQTVGVTSLPSLPAGSNAIGSVSVSNFPSTQAVSLSSVPLPVGAAQDGVDGTSITAPTGGSGIRGWLSGIYQKLGGTLAVSGTVSISGAVPVTGTFWQATQPVSGTVGVSGTVPVSLASVPLAANAAQETGGNLASLVSAQGAGGTGISQPTGGSGMQGWLSGIYQKISGTLATSRTWSLSSGSDSVTAAISGTPNVNVSNTSLAVTGTFWQATQPVSLSGNSATDGSTSITTGGTAQNLFGSTTPTNGFAVYNPDPTNDLWLSDSTTAAANGQGSIRLVANGGGYETPAGYKPLGVVSIYGATTGQKITARRW